jgi:hypothetical protein
VVINLAPPSGVRAVIDTLTEQVIPLNRVEVPSSKPGKRVHVATIRRWATPGIGGVCLETILCGGVRCTSKEALQRFFERVTIARDGEAAGPSSDGGVSRTPQARLRASERAAAELERLGL